MINKREIVVWRVLNETLAELFDTILFAINRCTTRKELEVEDPDVKPEVHQGKICCINE